MRHFPIDIKSTTAAFAGLAIALLLTSGAAAGELLTGAAPAASIEAGNQRTITLAQDWQTACDRSGEVETCRMSTTGSAKTGSGRTVAVQLASESTDGGEPLFFFLTPLDLLLARGAEMRIDDGKTHKLAFRSCHLQGCVIPFRPNSRLEGEFRRGSRLNLRLYEIDGEPIDVELSLLGLIAASKAIISGQ